MCNWGSIAHAVLWLCSTGSAWQFWFTALMKGCSTWGRVPALWCAACTDSWGKVLCTPVVLCITINSVSSSSACAGIPQPCLTHRGFPLGKGWMIQQGQWAQQCSAGYLAKDTLSLLVSSTEVIQFAVLDNLMLQPLAKGSFLFLAHHIVSMILWMSSGM